MLGRDQINQYIFSLFSTLEHGSDKLSTRYMIMMTKEVSTKYCKFHDPRCRVLLCVFVEGETQIGELKLCMMLMTCINIHQIDCYCVRGLHGIPIRRKNPSNQSYFMMGLIICKYESF